MERYVMMHSLVTDSGSFPTRGNRVFLRLGTWGAFVAV